MEQARGLHHQSCTRTAVASAFAGAATVAHWPELRPSAVALRAVQVGAAPGGGALVNAFLASRIREITHFHLFAGVGGGALGFQMAHARIGRTVARKLGRR